MAKYKFGKRSLDRLKGVHPVIVEAFEAALAHEDCPHDIGIPQDGGLRSTEDQQRLFAQGRSVGRKKLPIITWVDGVNKKSNHQAKEDGYGYAVDIYIYKNSTAYWNRQWLTEFARHLQEVAKEKFGLNISWGGDWERRDMPHFEYKGGILPAPKKKETAKVKKAPTPKKPVAAKKVTAKSKTSSKK